MDDAAFVDLEQNQTSHAESQTTVTAALLQTYVSCTRHAIST